MEWGTEGATGRPHEDGVEEEVDRLGLQEQPGQLGHRRFEHEPSVLVDPVPDLGVVQRGATVAIAVPQPGPVARLSQVVCHPGPQLVDPVLADHPS
jgi:hypothetical protein